MLFEVFNHQILSHSLIVLSMKSFLAVILTTSILFAGAPVYSQPTSGKVSSYKDFVLDGKNSWLLTTYGTLKVVSNESGKVVESVIENDAPIVALAKDRKGSLVIGDTTHQIKRYNKLNATWHRIAIYSGKLAGITFDSRNHCFAITSAGIFDLQQGKVFFPDSTIYFNDQIRNKRSWFETPTYLMDKRDRIWIGFDHGEWGGDVFAFDTQKLIFIRLMINDVQMTLNPVSSFCEDSQNVYMSGGISHMMLTHGSIIKFNDQIGSNILLSRDRKTPEKVTFDGPDGRKKSETWTTWKGGHQIGPVAYNPTDSCLYFYSQHGIFKGSLSSDLSDIEQWHNILKPSLQWSGGRPNAAGPAMNVLKMHFAPDGRLFFLTEHDGLGVYESKTLRFVK